METELIQPKNKIHPHKFTLWLGIGSIVMMFAGLTSAYIVKRNQADWQTFDIPVLFWYSTGIILLSSLTLQLSLKSFQSRSMNKYRRLMITTMMLGILFVVLQFFGFKEFWNQGMTLQASVSYSFLYVIVGLHAIHVFAGVVALMVMSLKSYSINKRTYSIVSVEMMNTYWHFVDVLWVYLVIFLMIIR